MDYNQITRKMTTQQEFRDEILNKLPQGTKESVSKFIINKVEIFPKGGSFLMGFNSFKEIGLTISRLIKNFNIKTNKKKFQYISPTFTDESIFNENWNYNLQIESREYFHNDPSYDEYYLILSFWSNKILSEKDLIEFIKNNADWSLGIKGFY